LGRARFDPFGDAEHVRGAVALDEVRTGRYGVVLWLADWNPGVAPRLLAEHGTFTVRFGNGARAIPYWDEVSESRVTSEASVFWHDTSFEHGRAVRRAETATCPGLYVTLNAEQPLIATIRMLAGLCLEILSDATCFEQRSGRAALVPLDWRSRHEYPSSFAAGVFAAKKLA